MQDSIGGGDAGSKGLRRLHATTTTTTQRWRGRLRRGSTTTMLPGRLRPAMAAVRRYLSRNFDFVVRASLGDELADQKSHRRARASSPPAAHPERTSAKSVGRPSSSSARLSLMGGAGLEPRPPACKAGALPAELTARGGEHSSFRPCSRTSSAPGTERRSHSTTTTRAAPGCSCACTRRSEGRRAAGRA